MLAEGNGKCESAAQARQHRLHGILRRCASLDFARNQVGDDFAVGLAFKRAARGNQFIAQRLEVFDDAVVHQRDFARCMGMRILRRRCTVRRPAGMRDTDHSRRRIARQFGDKIGQLARSAAANQLSALDGADPRAVVTAIFHSPEAIDQPVSHRFLADDPDNSAHCNQTLVCLRTIRTVPIDEKALDLV